MIGYGLGGFLSLALMIVAAVLFLPRGISPEFLGTPPLAAEHVLGQVGLVLALVGILFAVGGAAIETSFSGAYNLAQFFGWKWGKKERPAGAARFTLSWLVIFGLAMAVVMTGYDPVKLTEYSVIFSVVALPLTYLPILLVANDRSYMGANVNGRLANILGILYFVDHSPDLRRRHSPDAAHPRRPRMSQITDVDLALGILDHQLVDSNGQNCGKVDDLEITGLDGNAPGSGGNPRRRQRLALSRPPRPPRSAPIRERRPRAMARSRLRLIGRDPQAPSLGTALESRRRSLGRPRRKAPRILMRLSQLLNRKVVTESGRTLGRVHDIRGQIVGRRLAVTGLVAGELGLLERYGIGTGGNGRPSQPKAHNHDIIPWKRVLYVGSQIIVRD